MENYTSSLTIIIFNTKLNNTIQNNLKLKEINNLTTAETKNVIKIVYL